MATVTSVGITSGVPSSGTGNVSTIDQLIAVGSPISNGSTSAPATVTITGASSVVTSTMSALVTAISSNSAPHTVVISSNPTVILSSNPTVILSSNPTITSVSSGSIAITAGSNTANVVGGSSAVTSSMSALVVALSTLGAAVSNPSSGLLLTKGSYGAAQLTQASVSAATSGNNILVTRAVGTIKVYGLYAVPDSGMTIQFCNGSTASVLSGAMTINSISLPIQTEPYFTTTGTNNFVVNLSTSVTLAGMIYYLDS